MPAIGMTKMTGAVNADINMPILAVVAPNSSISDPSTGESSAVPSGESTLMTNSNWDG